MAKNNKAKFKLLIPFKPAMVVALKAKKVPVKITDSIESVAQKFYNKIVKKSNFEDNYGYHGMKYNYEQDRHLDFDSIDPVTVSVIISAIVNWFKKKKEEKDAGMPLSEGEQKAVTIGENVQEQANQFQKDITEEKTGETLMKLLPFAAIGLALFFFMRKK
jgi:hypothetical protein